MKNRVTHFKALLFLLALMFGLQSYAQDNKPIKNTGNNQTTDVKMSPSNQKPANWNLENEVYQSALNADPNASNQSVNEAQKKAILSAPLQMSNEAEKLQKIAAKEAYHAAKLAQTGDNMDQESYEAAKLAKIAASAGMSGSCLSQSNPFSPNSNTTINSTVDRSANIDNNQPNLPIQPTDAIWDILINFTGLAGQTGIATDGNYFYVGYWNYAGRFSKYTLNGTFVETFTIAGGPLTRNMTYMPNEGLFYCSTGSATITKVNLNNHTVAGSITAGGTGYCRHLSFDPSLDGGNGGFWTGDWYNLKTIKMNGQLIADIPSFSQHYSSSTYYGVYGSALDQYAFGGPYLYFYAQEAPNSDVEITRYKISTDTYTLAHETTDLPLYQASDIAGGLTVSIDLVPGKIVMLGVAQNSPCHIFEYELSNTIFYPNDVGIYEILGPNAGTGLGIEDVEVVVANFGTLPQSNFPVSFTVNNGTPVTIQYTNTLAPGAGDTIVIGTYDFSAQNTYVIHACTDLTGDQQANNDCLDKMITNNMFGHDTIYPGNAALWTGTTDGAAFTETSFIKCISGGGYQGWAKFDLSSIADGATVTGVSLHYNVFESSIPYFQLTHLTVDPMTNTASTVYNGITSGFSYGYLTSAYSVGWHHIAFDMAAADVQAGLTNNWYAVGFWEYETGGSYYLHCNGWAQPERPYLVVDYSMPLANDVGISAITNPNSGSTLGANEPVTVTIHNYGTNPQSNIPVYFSVNGGPQITNTFAGPLAPLSDATFTIGNYDFSGFGYYTIEACTQLGTDQLPTNNCNSKTVFNLLVGHDTIWPQLEPYWTGTTTGNIFSEDSYIHGVSTGEQGWAKFVLPTNMPSSAQVTSASVHYYVESSNGGPYLQITNVSNDPMTGSPASVLADIADGPAYGTYTSEAYTGWHHLDINNAASDISAAVANGWFALGFYEYESYAGYDFSIEGWAQTNVPYMVIDYLYTPVYNDLAVKGLLSPVSSSTIGQEDVIVDIRNCGINAQSDYYVTCRVDGVLLDSLHITNPLAQYTIQSINFGPWNFQNYQDYTIDACVYLTGDEFPANDCKSFSISKTLPIAIDTLYPKDSAYWTGTTDGNSFTQNSLIQTISGGSGYQGYAKFDLAGLTPGVNITNLAVEYYVNASYIPYFRFTRLVTNPIALPLNPALVYNEIRTGESYGNITNGYTVGWNSYILDAAVPDLINSVPSGWFGLGFNEYETGGSYYLHVDGWNEANPPMLIVQGMVPVPHDLGVKTFNLDPFITPSPVYPSAVIKNYGSTPEAIFDVVFTAPGYSSTFQYNNPADPLDPGEEILIASLDVWNPALGTSPTMTVCVACANDPYAANNCKSASTSVEPSLTPAYAFTTDVVNPVKFFLEHPNMFTDLAASSISTNFLASGCWANGVWYAAEYMYEGETAGGHLFRVNHLNGEMTDVGPLGMNFNGMTYDPTTNTIIGVTSYSEGSSYHSKLYSINPNNAVVTELFDMGTVLGLPINLAISPGGLLYTIDLMTERFYTINPTDGTWTFMETLPYNFNYAQDAEFNYNTGRLYLAGYTSEGTLFKYSPQNLELEVTGTFMGGQEMTAFAIPYVIDTVMYDVGIREIFSPKSGNTTNGEPVIVYVRNMGTEPISHFGLGFKFWDVNGNLAQTVQEWWDTCTYGYILNPGEEFPYAFIPVSDMSQPGTYKVQAWVFDTTGQYDMRYQNDTVGKKVYNVSCSISCFANALNELEICGDTTNDGCNLVIPTYETVVNGQAYCGTSWKYSTYRDTDWYSFTLTSPQSVTVKASAEFPLQIMLVSLPCSSSTQIGSFTISQCTTDSLYVNFVPAGEYAIVVAPDWLAYDMTCNANNQYTFNFLLGTPKYCAGYTTTSGCLRYIGGVKVGMINNQGTGCSTNPTGYGDYTNLFTNMLIGQTDTIQVTCPSSIWVNWLSVGAWIDWNHDYDFEDANEKIVFPTLSTFANYVSTITVPADAIEGPTRLRVRLISSSGTLIPCGSNSWGEIEDYTINVTTPVLPVVAHAPILSDVCPGEKIIPITVENFKDINGFNLVLGITSGISYLGVQNVDPQIAANLQVIGNPTNITANWFSTTSATIPDNTVLFELVVNVLSGTHLLIWDQGVEGCQFSNFTHGILEDNYVDGQLTYGNCSNLEGFVRYKNPTIITGTPNTPMNGTIVTLTGLANTVVDTTDLDGHYEFLNLPLDTYTMSFVTTKLFGGINATDAMFILKHFVHLQMLTGLNLACADVNGSVTINSTDALVVCRRFVNAIPGYYPPYTSAPGGKDWYFTQPTIVVNGTANQVQDIWALCGGDVNGSYAIAYPFKGSPTVNINTDGSKLLNGKVEIPVRVESELNAGAISLVMNYPSRLDITDVQISNNPENLTYTANNGQLRLAWFSNEAFKLNAGDVLITITAKLNSLNKESISFVTTNECQITNEEGVIYDNVNLLMPKLVSTISEDDYSLSNYPNPFNQTTTITYSIPVKGFVTVKVYNVLGEEVALVVNSERNAGTYNIDFESINLQRGVYYYKLEVNGITKTRSMVIGE